MDFGVLPPEVNSARMYSGAGPGPLLAAASAWQGLATELNAVATAYASALSDIGGQWRGPSAQMMTATAAPFVAWIGATAGQAAQSGAQATAAAAAYETAFAATVPPPVIAANRSLLATLIATNILGQNTPAIAATEAHYVEMWAQDAAAMYGYVGAASTASELDPFVQPPKAGNEAGAANQATAAAHAAAGTGGTSVQDQLSQLISSLSNLLNQAAPPPGPPSLTHPGSLGLSDALGIVTGANTPIGGAYATGTGWLTAMQILALAQNGQGVAGILSGAPPISGAFGPLSGGYVSIHQPVAGAVPTLAPGARLVSATTGRAASIGSLSVPTGWASAAPDARVAAVLPTGAAGVTATAAATATAGTGGMFSEMALASLAGRALAGTAVNASAGGGVRVLDRAPDTEELTSGTATILVIPAEEE